MTDHSGHRSRKRRQFRDHGIDAFADHEVLELLLYYAIPRRDTNPAAHALLDRFGDLAGVLEASEEELCRVEGVGPASARLLHLLPQVSACYHASRVRDRRKLQTTEQIGQYMMDRFRGATEEKALLVCLDGSRRIVGAVWLAAGGREQVELPVRAAIAQAVRFKARSAVLAHNHPSGNILPSREDIQATAELARGMYLIGARLLDHIIVTDTEYLSMRQRSEVPDGEISPLRIFELRGQEET